MENPIKMDDLGVPLFLETPIYDYICICVYTLPETNDIAPENRPGPNRKVVCQPPLFKGYVSFRECTNIMNEIWHILITLQNMIQ